MHGEYVVQVGASQQIVFGTFALKLIMCLSDILIRDASPSLGM